MKDSICVFPDTNVFLHYPPLDQIDWLTICDAKSVQLVLCLTVIHELDAKKSDPRLSDRAERAIKEIRAASKSAADIREGVCVGVFNKEIRSADFPDTLSPDSADDRIVHLAKVFKDKNSDKDVAIATGDYGMELRAESGGVMAIALDSSLRLPNPQDELTKKYKQAVSELNTLKNRQPKLALGLSLPDGQMARPHEVQFELGEVWKPLDIEAEMERVYNENPKQAGLHAQAKHLMGAASLLGTFGSAESWERYDNKLDQFYDEYRKHLELVNIVGAAKARAFEFDLWLTNDGNGLATDVDVVLHFPAIVRFVADKGTEDAEPLENEFEPPEPPERPNPLAGIGGINMVPSLDFGAMADSPFARNFRTDDWTPDAHVKRTDGELMEAHARITKVKHGHNVCLGKFIAVFDPEEEIKPFKANYVISTSDLAEKIEGKIPFIVRRQNTTSSSPC